MNANEPILKIADLHASYEKVHVLQGVSLEIQAGEAVALLGRNGVGKTTTLKSIMGLIPSKAQQIVFNGLDLSKIKPYQLASHGIGYVPQGRGIFPNLTVRENLNLGVIGKPDPAVTEYVFSRFPRLKERIDQMGGTLSGGEQQMLAISRCLMMKPKLIILDEPTEGIMPMLVAQIRDEIAAISKSGVSILLVEQNVRTALKLCSRIYVMEKGKIIFNGVTDHLKNEPEILNNYLGIKTAH
jgi:branched-chain amino acid transport system ATP-binding protein